MSKIELTHVEQEQYDLAFKFNPKKDYEENQNSLDALQALTESIIAREAIPKNRLKYFIDREYQHGRTKMTRKEVFESNGTKGKKMFRHPHFIKYVDYFINGAKISLNVYEVAKSIADSQSFQDEAIQKIYDYLKSSGLIPKEKNSKNKFADEIFKLAVDLGFDSDYCKFIRTKIMR
ncbi:hypothetical protein DMA11_06790 [Marinilabiliaceae bacterium JC017]|nr:hypothetical protein DMA11_06790 [Marinilabiliaceae bacterium JC017]